MQEMRLTVKNTFVEFAEVADGRSPRRSTSVGCARDLRTRRASGSAREELQQAAPETPIPAVGELLGDRLRAVSSSCQTTVGDPVAHVAASLPPGYTLTLRHEGRNAKQDPAIPLPVSPRSSASDPAVRFTGNHPADGPMRIAAALPVGGSVTVSHPATQPGMDFVARVARLGWLQPGVTHRFTVQRFHCWWARPARAAIRRRSPCTTWAGCTNLGSANQKWRSGRHMFTCT